MPVNKSFELDNWLINKSAHNRSLFASKSIQTGDCILKIPYNVQIAPDNLPPKVASLFDNEVGNVAKLAIIILIEQKRSRAAKVKVVTGGRKRRASPHSSRTGFNNVSFSHAISSKFQWLLAT
jgi:hypothetical protein